MFERIKLCGFAVRIVNRYRFSVITVERKLITIRAAKTINE